MRMKVTASGHNRAATGCRMDGNSWGKATHYAIGVSAAKRSHPVLCRNARLASRTRCCGLTPTDAWSPAWRSTGKVGRCRREQPGDRKPACRPKAVSDYVEQLKEEASQLRVMSRSTVYSLRVSALGTAP